MALTKLGSADANTIGNLPATGSVAPAFILSGNDMKDVNSNEFVGKTIVLIFSYYLVQRGSLRFSIWRGRLGVV